MKIFRHGVLKIRCGAPTTAELGLTIRFKENTTTTQNQSSLLTMNHYVRPCTRQIRILFAYGSEADTQIRKKTSVFNHCPVWLRQCRDGNGNKLVVFVHRVYVHRAQFGRTGFESPALPDRGSVSVFQKRPIATRLWYHSMSRGLIIVPLPGRMSWMNSLLSISSFKNRTLLSTYAATTPPGCPDEGRALSVPSAGKGEFSLPSFMNRG